jgi:hypothetical protein
MKTVPSLFTLPVPLNGGALRGTPGFMKTVPSLFTLPVPLNGGALRGTPGFMKMVPSLYTLPVTLKIKLAAPFKQKIWHQRS